MLANIVVSHVDRDWNLAINILNQCTVGRTGSQTCGDLLLYERGQPFFNKNEAKGRSMLRPSSAAQYTTAKSSCDDCFLFFLSRQFCGLFFLYDGGARGADASLAASDAGGASVIASRASAGDIFAATAGIESAAVGGADLANARNSGSTHGQVRRGRGGDEGEHKK